MGTHRAFTAWQSGDRGVTAEDNRLSVEAVLRIARTGSPGGIFHRNWAIGITCIRASRWGKSGVWQRVIEAVQTDADPEALLLDSTIVRAHQHAAGAQKRRCASDWPLARRVDTKIHMAVDALAIRCDGISPVARSMTSPKPRPLSQALTPSR